MFITNKDRSDGFGAQYQTIIFTILFAELMGLEFVYSPFNKMDHNYDNDPFFIEKKENLINIQNNFTKKDNVEQNKIVNFDLSQIYSSVEGRLDYCLSTDSFKKIKNLFYKKNPIPVKSNKKIVNIHIRRPNIFDIGSYGYNTDEYFISIIDEIKEKHLDIEKITIYSQGKIEDFSKFNDYGVDFKLNLSIEETFTDLVFSDILVMSKSSLSYCAGLLCEGIVYYTPFWHKPKNTWIKI
jgi:hypothetical protein